MNEWKGLAVKWVRKLGKDQSYDKIVLATIEAETGGRNVLGDSGNALGYGQVWAKKWHYQKLKKVAGILGVRIPSQTSPIQEFQKVVLGNDDLSMGLAVQTIISFWEGAGKDWVTFTKRYVGPSIPSSDLERRRKIWMKYSSDTVSLPVVEGTEKIELDVEKMGQEELKKYASIGLLLVAAVALIK